MLLECEVRVDWLSSGAAWQVQRPASAVHDGGSRTVLVRRAGCRAVQALSKWLVLLVPRSWYSISW